MSGMSLAEARNRALSQAMREDERVLLMGGIAGRPGLTALTVPDDLDGRNIEISISELGAVGAALGAAAAGMRPVLTVHQGVFLMQAWPQIVQEASKLPFTSGGSIRLPVVVHMDTGITGDRDSRSGDGEVAGEAASLFERPWPTRAAQHSMSPEGMLMTLPGIQIVVPTTPADAAGLMLSAIASDAPTMFIEHHDLLFTRTDVAEPFEPVPLGTAAVRRKGADVSIVAHSIMVGRALRAAEILAAEYGVDAEVLDLRSLAPLDIDAVLATVRKTRHVVLADQGHRTGGVAAAISSLLAERAFGLLDAPVGFVCTPDVPIPFSIALLDEVSPLTEDIVRTALATTGSA
jgi:pyruvate dehydrogenase E1 component beta subunit